MNQTWENGKKHNFGPDFGPFGPNVGPQNVSWVLHLLVVRVLSYHPMQFPEKLMNLTWENGEKPNLDPILACLAQMLFPSPTPPKKIGGFYLN